MIDPTTQHTRAVYIDLEWLCWHSPPPPGLRQEIIEIGVVEMDLVTLSLIKEASYFVRPRRWGLSAECEQLTGITRQDILSGRPLLEVLMTIADTFQLAGMPCCSWGNDFKMLAEACHHERHRNPFERPVDLAWMFGDLFLTELNVSLRNAVQMLGLPFDGIVHGALPDARNAARVHAELLRRVRPSIPHAATMPSDAVSEVSDFTKKLAASLK
ncbi:3'-5' exonuclease [Granulicella aggregans]|uniref:3'-5' exonuclease n=1 Tax=Granulicella aggregans TaxID=474949 RepID=UPI0021DF4DB1|nr:3'-5' exonuclease [Granulicella aggregans]